MAKMSVRSGIRIPDEFDRAVELARKAGWTVGKRQGSKHIQWKPPGGGPIITTSLTPLDSRTTRNELARLRRAGLEV